MGEDKALVSVQALPDANGRVIMGSDMITLRDCSTTTFKTTILLDFINFCKHDLGEKIAEALLVYNLNGAQVWLPHDPDLQTAQPVAQCMLELTDHVDALNHLSQGKGEMRSEQLEDFLSGMSHFLSDTGLRLLSFVRQHSIKKTETIERKVDSQGNMAIMYQLEGCPIAEEQLPKRLELQVPLFRGHTITVPVSLEISFTIKRSERNPPELIWKLRDTNFIEKVSLVAREQLLTYFGEFSNCFFGAYVVNKATDAWRHQTNPLIVKDR